MVENPIRDLESKYKGKNIKEMTESGKICFLVLYVIIAYLIMIYTAVQYIRNLILI